jgi:hypothetical protein
MSTGAMMIDSIAASVRSYWASILDYSLADILEAITAEICSPLHSDIAYGIILGFARQLIRLKLRIYTVQIKLLDRQ